MKKIYKFCTAMILTLMVFLLAMNGLRRQDAALAARIAPEILRFHVLANSDSAEDQAVKLAVKDFLLAIIQEDLNGTFPHITKDMVEQYILDNKSKLEVMAELYMEEIGFNYPVTISLEACEFPRKTYGDMTFPAGTYEAVRVLIGDGAGENFWCVLYPSLCYIDSTYAVVPDASKDILRTLIPEDDFHALLSARRAETTTKNQTEQDSLLPRVTVRFKFAELLSAYFH